MSQTMSTDIDVSHLADTSPASDSLTYRLMEDRDVEGVKALHIECLPVRYDLVKQLFLKVTKQRYKDSHFIGLPHRGPKSMTLVVQAGSQIVGCVSTQLLDERFLDQDVRTPLLKFVVTCCRRNSWVFRGFPPHWFFTFRRCV